MSQVRRKKTRDVARRLNVSPTTSSTFIESQSIK